MKTKEYVAETMNVSGGSLNRFNTETLGGNLIEGWINKSAGNHMGSLFIDSLNNRSHHQLVQGMVKLHYLNKDSFDLIDPKIFEKSDGSNICAFPLMEDGECIEVLFKTRMTPVVQNKLMKRVELGLDDKYYKMVEQEKLSFAFECYGTQNPHMLNYGKLDVDIALDLLAVFDFGRGLPASFMMGLADKYGVPHAMEHFIVETEGDVEGVKLVPTEYFLSTYGDWMPDDEGLTSPTLEDVYRSLENYYEKINMAFQKECGGSIIEGSVWHYLDPMGQNIMIKNKAMSIREDGGRGSATGIPTEIIRKALFKMDDEIVDAEAQWKKNKDVLINFVNWELLEEYNKEVVDTARVRNKINSEMAKFFRKVEIPSNVTDLAQEIIDANPDVSNPTDLMRIFGMNYPDLKNLSGKMFQAFQKQAVVI
jgi:hypothetical protein